MTNLFLTTLLYTVSKCFGDGRFSINKYPKIFSKFYNTQDLVNNSHQRMSVIKLCREIRSLIFFTFRVNDQILEILSGS